METAIREQGHLEASDEIGFEDDAASVNEDDDFDFDINGLEDNLIIQGLESTDDGLTHEAVVGTYTYQRSGQHFQGEGGKDYLGHEGNDHQSSGSDAAAENENENESFDQELQDDEFVGDYGQGTSQEDEGQQQESEKCQEEIYDDEAANDAESCIANAQPHLGQVQDSTNTTTSVEYPQQRDESLEDFVRARDKAVIYDEGDDEQSVKGDHAGEMIENGTTYAAEFQGEGIVDGFGAEHAPNQVDQATVQLGADVVNRFEDVDSWDAKSDEDHQDSTEHPHVRVSYRTSDFSLFAESKDDDPDEYFLKDTHVLHQPLSHFLMSLRQVIADELAPSEELFVKIDGLGLEFAESTTRDFLDQTSFGQVLDLHSRLIELDKISEAPEPLVFLETRPNCIHRLDELMKYADEGKGMSQIAISYEDLRHTIAEDNEDGDDFEIHEDINSDGMPLDESYDEVGENTEESFENDQVFTPLRPTNGQQEDVDSESQHRPEDGIDSRETFSADASEIRDLEDARDGPADVHNELQLETTEFFHDGRVDENPEATIIGEFEEGALVDANDGYEIEDEEEQGQTNNQMDVAIAEATGQNEITSEEHSPTDGEILSLLKSHECTADTQLCNCKGRMFSWPSDDWQFPSFITCRLDVSSLTSMDQEPLAVQDAAGPHRTENKIVDFHIQDLPAVENDDYLEFDAADEAVAQPTDSLGTTGPMSHNSRTTETLVGEDHNHLEDASAHEYADSSRPIQAADGPEVDPSEKQIDEIYWNDEENDEVDVADQSQTNLSPLSHSAKRGRQGDEVEEGPGDESTVKRRRT